MEFLDRMHVVDTIIETFEENKSNPEFKLRNALEEILAKYETYDIVDVDIDAIQAQGYDEGYDDGYSDGHFDGFQEGCEQVESSNS